MKCKICHNTIFKGDSFCHVCGFMPEQIKHKKPKHDEQDMQIAIVKWFRLQYPKIKCTISPGGLITNGATGSKAKKMGYEAGQPDLFFMKSKYSGWKKESVWENTYYGLFVELKIPGGLISPEQKNYMDYLKKEGYKVVVCYSFDEAKQTIDDYMRGEK